MPLTPPAAWSIIRAAGREVLWGLPAVSREIGAWRARAETIPDRRLRHHAVHSIVYKRNHAEGAALFSILPKHRDRGLIRLLVAYQTILDYLDTVSERQTGSADGRQLHLALIEAVDPAAPLSDYYAHHPARDDGGYLRALVEVSRASCAALPSYPRVRHHVLVWVTLFAAVQSHNHERDPERRDAAIRAWVERQLPGLHPLAWFELAATASAAVPHALLALAAEPYLDDHDLAAVCTAYFPWVSLATAMLDSYADQRDDALSGDHSYISHYGDTDAAVERLCAIVDRTAREARGLPDGHRHATIVACTAAMYLSCGCARTPDMRERTLAIARAGGSVTRLLMPVVRLWRVMCLRRSTPNAQREHQVLTRAGLPPGPHLPRPVQTFALWASPFMLLERSHGRYGSRFTLKPTSHPPLVFLSDPDDIRMIMAAPADVLHPGEGAATIEPLVGHESFMLLDEDEHLAGRKAILPAFGAGAVQGHAELVANIAQRHVASWPRDVAFALHPRLLSLALEVALQTTLGTSAHSADERLVALHNRLLAMLSVTGSAVLPEPLLRHGPGRMRWRRFLSDRTEVDELIYDIIRDRGRSGGADTDLLDRLLFAHNTDGSSMSPHQVRDNLMSTLLAGHETTAAQLAWAFQLLAHNPLVLDRLLEEIDGDTCDEYLTATVREVLRHRPVFLFAIPREVKQPIELGGWTYRPPAQLLGCIYLMHHDRTLYPEPHRFLPERFLKTRAPVYTWLPWGGGRKRCPGWRLATLEMKTVLRTALATMTVRPAAERIERPRWRSVIVAPHAGSRVVLEERHRVPGRRSHVSDRCTATDS
jgi:tetraprenyl-beta-curcumene synthase